MRIKEEIKRSGFFWLPSVNGNPSDNHVFGTLTILDGGDIELELSEPLVTDIQEFKLDGLNQILGHVEKDGPITLDRCRSISNKSGIVHNAWMGSEVIKADRVFTGIRYDGDASPCFNAVSFSVEGIDEWVGISGIEVNNRFENSASTILYNRPEDISFTLKDDMQLLITFAWKPPGFPTTKRAEVSQKTYFKLISKEARELDKFTAIASKITAFLCFVMNEIVCLDEISATNDDLRQSVEIYCRTWPYAKDEPVINALDMLFRFEEKQNRVESLINKWLENYEQIAPAFDLYFLTKAGTLPSLDLHFLTLVQALEAFHRRTSDEMHMDADECKEIRKKMIGECPEEHKDWFRPKLLRANELTLKNRFERMTEPFGNFMCGENRPGLIKSIKDTRNYLTHYDSDLESKAAKGKVLEFLCLKMNALFRLQFLKLIGFDEQEINAIVDKCSYFKGECNLGRSLADE